MLWCLRLLAGFLILITVLPLFSTGKWYVRWWDFPRFQIAILLLLPLAIAAVGMFRRNPAHEYVAWFSILICALVWQASHVIQFSPIWPKEIASSQRGSESLKLLVANLDYNNPDPAPVASELESEHPELLLLIEYDEGWQNHLSELRKKFTHHHEEIRGDGLGIALWSTVPLKDSETRYLVSDRRASIWTSAQLPDGNVLNIVGVHPTPPGLLDSTGDQRRDSRVRDAELIMIAREIAQRQNETWAVAGDFNDVAWSHTTRLFKRISGLKDPRVGRSFMGTYIANYPPLRCPIDHVFLSDCFTVADLARKKITGSDHFAVLAALHLEAAIGVSPEPEGNDQTDAGEIIKEGKEDAQQRGVSEDD